MPTEAPSPRDAVGAHVPYRPDLDGLRALAVLIVIGYHAWPKAVPGGFVGVDVFFVISGFLIAQLIRRQVNDGTFSFQAFYAHRARRILPALVVMLLALWCASLVLPATGGMRTLGEHLLGASTFTSNFLLWKSHRYFDPGPFELPLTHLWSLAVEEQFYLVMPALMVLAMRWDRWRSLLVVLATSSLAWSVLGVGAHPAAVFYLLPSRMWELLAGAVVSELPRSRVSGPVASAASVFALLALCGACWFLSAELDYPGAWAAWPVSAAMVLVAVGDRAITRHLLATRPVVALGLVSYPLYLWHFPMLMLARAARVEPLDGESTVALLAGALVASVLTWAIVERPVKRGVERLAGRPGGLTVVLLASAGALLLVAGLGGITSHRWMETTVQAQARALEDRAMLLRPDYRTGECFFDSDELPTGFGASCDAHPTAADPRVVLIWGDSYAAHLTPGLMAALGGGLAQRTVSVCPPFVDYEDGQESGRRCAALNAGTVSWIAEHKPTTVVLAANWMKYGATAAQLMPHLDVTLAAIRAAGGAEIVIVGQAPTWIERVPLNLEVHYLREGRPLPKRLPYGLEPGGAKTDDAMAKALNGRGVRYVSLWRDLCNEDGCLIALGDPVPDRLTTWDQGHFTVEGSVYAAEQFILPAIERRAEPGP